MKTESRTHEVEFAGARAPTPADDASVLTVYLDQWCWHRLVMDRAGAPLDESERGVYGALRCAVADGRARFVLSQACGGRKLGRGGFTRGNGLLRLLRGPSSRIGCGEG